jgi:hypothetical protein
MVTGSPDFTGPALSKPYLTAVTPEPWTVSLVKGTGTSPSYPLPAFKFEIASEDMNTRGLFAQLVLDYPGPTVTGMDIVKGVIFSTQNPFPPGHLGPGEIVARTEQIDSVSLGVGTRTGCHSITLFVSHEFMMTRVLPETPGDLGTLTWWVFAQDPLGQTPTPGELADCLTVTTGDGG